METSRLRKRMPVTALTDPKIVLPAIGSAFAKLDPRVMMKNPVMFVVEAVAALTTVIFIREWMGGGEHLGFTFQIILWLWFTVLFANFAEAVAGSLVAKKIVPASSGTFPTHGGLFIGLVVGVILIVGGLSFFPALALGPIVEHYAMMAGQLF